MCACVGVGQWRCFSVLAQRQSLQRRFCPLALSFSLLFVASALVADEVFLCKVFVGPLISFLLLRLLCPLRCYVQVERLFLLLFVPFL